MIERELLRMVDTLRDQVHEMTAAGNCDRTVYLQHPLTSTSWDGDAYSTTAKTLIDMSAVFGVPAQVRFVLIKLAISDSGSDAADCYMILAPTNTALEGMSAGAPTPKTRWGRECLVVPCDANGDIYYQIVASDSSTLDVVLKVWGYMI